MDEWKIALFSSLLGAIVGFGGSLLLWWLQLRKDRELRKTQDLEKLNASLLDAKNSIMTIRHKNEYDRSMTLLFNFNNQMAWYGTQFRKEFEEGFRDLMKRYAEFEIEIRTDNEMSKLRAVSKEFVTYLHQIEKAIARTLKSKS
jgi:hypothetical protein